MNKDFDCVAFKRAAAARIRKRLEGMSREEELAYWRRGTEELLSKQAAARAREDSEVYGEDHGREGRGP